MQELPRRRAIAIEGVEPGNAIGEMKCTLPTIPLPDADRNSHWQVQVLVSLLVWVQGSVLAWAVALGPVGAGWFGVGKEMVSLRIMPTFMLQPLPSSPAR